jgi:protein-S-isoprenylcysteine O-methyltransferase Ste14
VNHHPSGILTAIVAIFWLTFLLYWTVSAVGVKKTVRGKGSFKGWLGARLAFVIILIALYRMPVFAPFWHFAYGWTFFNNEAIRIAGAVLAACGIAFALWARAHLGRNWSGRATMKVGHELITSGPYQYVRHPIYTGILAALLGSGFVDGPFWLVVLLFAAVVFTWRIRKEESYMMELFPDQYAAYRARTKALIPAVW